MSWQNFSSSITNERSSFYCKFFGKHRLYTTFICHTCLLTERRELRDSFRYSFFWANLKFFGIIYSQHSNSKKKDKARINFGLYADGIAKTRSNIHTLLIFLLFYDIFVTFVNPQSWTTFKFFYITKYLRELCGRAGTIHISFMFILTYLKLWFIVNEIY